MFAVNVNSVRDTRSRLVSITATAAVLLFSYRPGCIANRTVKPVVRDELAERLLRMPRRFICQGARRCRGKRLVPPNSVCFKQGYRRLGFDPRQSLGAR